MEQDKIDKLLDKLDLLLKKQDFFKREIDEIKQEINSLNLIKKNIGTTSNKEIIIEDTKTIISQKSTRVKKSDLEITQDIERRAAERRKNPKEKPNVKYIEKRKPKGKSDFEKFIGENLINKIGILITVIGVGIGAKYSIENDLISPLTRIILGYLIGLGLLGFGMKLKAKYESFSAVLVSGAMAIMYFITFAAYSFYGILPVSLTFILMLLFTVFTVFTALNYNKQVIAVIGLVGAYGVPFLLSSGSGRVDILYSYMAIINIGILVISVKKYWKPLYYVTFAVTWLIFTAWFFGEYEVDNHFKLALLFATVFFFIFYATILSYKLVNKEKFVKSDVVLMLSNSFIYFGLGYAILDSHEVGRQFLGLFALVNAIIHFAVTVTIYKQKLADKNLFYLVAGLVLVFVTVAVPIQLDGSWVTLFWAGEAALLFWIGRTKSVSFYEKLAFPLMLFAFVSLLQDWDTSSYLSSYYSDSYMGKTPVFNLNFLFTLLFVVIFSFVVYISRNTKYKTPDFKNKLYSIALLVLPIALLLVTYNMFRNEIDIYFSNIINSTAIVTSTENGYDSKVYNYDLSKFNSLWQINYTLLFLSILAFINYKKIKNQLFSYGILAVMIFSIFGFLSTGLFNISELRDNYIHQTSEYFTVGYEAIAIRYISFLFVALALVVSYRFIIKEFFDKKFKDIFLIAMHIPILWTVSSELIHWLDFAGSANNYKLGLSILWGLYSLLLVVLGIWKNNKILRIGAIGLFGITLAKLFLYDIRHLNTISKTIVFVSLGILLLFISFLYNKYKHKITDENENEII